ncbi:hypothetical protein [Streptomyces sp. NPDC090036]|uniref:hypothetical protein n=1 Tax=Streptomyces sp. NPDC090036 TaxID=3365926 RepID=UPI003821A8C8
MATAVLAAFVLAGCSAQGAPGDAAARPAGAGAMPHRAAEHVLAKKCMAGYSLAHRPPGRAAAGPGVDRRYGLPEQDSGLASGQRLPPSQPSTQAQLSTEEISVLYGRRGSEGKTGPLGYGGKSIPEEGCLGQSILDFRKDYDRPQAVEAARRISTQS